MTLLEAYLFLFFDSLMSMLVMVPNTSMVFNAMQVLENYNLALMVTVSMVGDLLGGSLNYIFGKILHYVKQRSSEYKDSEKFTKLSQFVNGKLFALVAFAFIPLLGVIFTTAAGFFRMSYSKFFLFLILGRCAYYAFKLS